MHPAIKEIEEDHTQLIFRLRIGGLPICYYGGATTPPAPTATDFDGDAIAGLSYSLYEGLGVPGSMSEEFDPLTGLPRKSGNCNVSINSNGLREDLYPDDPGRVLMRQGLKGADWTADLLERLPHSSTSPATIKVSRDPSGLSFPRLVYVGLEAIWVTGHGGTGTALDPYTLTVGARGALGSPIQIHNSNPSRGDVSVVSSHKIFWHRTPASLEVASRRTTDGSVSPFLEVVAGVLDGDPSAGSGEAISLAIAPMDALINSTLSAGQVATRLVENRHLFVWPRASYLWALQVLPQGMIEGAVSGRVEDAEVGYLLTGPQALEQHRQVFDPAHGHGATDPRRGPIYHQLSDEDLIPDGYAEDDPLGARFLLLSPNAQGQPVPTTDQTAGDPWYTPTLAYNQLVPLVTPEEGEKLYRWPAGVQSIWNGVTGMNPQTTQGEAGAFLSLRLDTQAGFIDVSPNAVPVSGATVLLSPRHPNVDGLLPARNYLSDEWALQDPLVPVGGLNQAFQGAQQRIELERVPSSFYDRSERHILVEDDAPATPPFPVLVKHVDRDGQEQEWLGTVTASEAVLDGGSTAGYKWTVEPRPESRRQGFANYGSRPEIKPVILIEDDITVVLLNLLMSGNGQGVNSATYDVYPFGLNLKEERIDIDSFLRFPRGLARWKRRVEDGANVREVFEGILHLLGAALTTRIDRATATQKLALIPLGQPNKVVAYVGFDDWSLIGPPKTVQHREVFNRYIYKVHLDGVDEPLSVPVDHVSGRTARGDAVEPREIDLEGLVLYTQDVGEIENRLRLAGSRMLNYTAFARKRFRLTMNLAVSYQLSRGDVIVVSSAYLFPHNPGQGRGVGTVPTRIVRIDRDIRGGRATLLVEYSAADGVGYAPELKVASAPAANQIVALANEYTTAQHPVTGEAQTDMQAGPGTGYFVVGDAVKVFRRGDWQNRVETTISAIDYDTNTVTFADDVNVGAEGWWAVKLNMKARGYAHLGPAEDGSAQAYT